MTPALLNWFSGNAGFILTRICANEKAAEAFKKLKLQNVRTRCYFDFLDARKHTMIKREDLNYFSYVSISVFLCLSGLHISEAEGDDPFGESRQIACKNGCGNFHLIGGIPRNQNPKQDWCQVAPTAYVVAQIARFMMPLTVYFVRGMRCPAKQSQAKVFILNTRYNRPNTIPARRSSSGQRSVLAGEVDNYSSGTSNESPISLRPEMVKEWRDGGSSCGNKRKKKGEEAMVESSIFLTSSPPSSLVSIFVKGLS
ncbi:hypothetical protein NC652_012394 [Populus alba x Populus x berolinensis]|nr:hypothetical protein NC652_012394 [Populus alba x Populus x berolinensis]